MLNLSYCKMKETLSAFIFLDEVDNIWLYQRFDS